MAPKCSLVLFATMQAADSFLLTDREVKSLQDCYLSGTKITLHKKLATWHPTYDVSLDLVFYQNQYRYGLLLALWPKLRSVLTNIFEPSIEASTAMIEGYSGNGQPKEAADVLRMVLRSGPVAEVVMALGFSAMIRPFFMEEALRHGQEIHAHIIKSGHKPENKHLSALVNLYAKCDKMAIAYRVFEGLEIKEFGLCRRLLAGFVRNGLYVEALKVYAEMFSLDYGMSHFVVINALRACVGMRGLEEGRQIHDVLIKVENLMGSTSLDVLTELYSSSGKHEEALK
ncbi:pentatricopeptide repeat-containing protein At4g19191, mitochondrial-like, partial [Phalaenopsis equestris]|uniref:pentatricopeptide repeat-containing protein At4g19191, mitochondrial-like n=1 Tax=Phalaenopsis equestris TaxID=78828 RepID=UPI0009E27651